MSNPNPQNTYAVVIGIEKYDPGSSWDLPGAAANALDFAKCLLDRDVPLDNIMLYISELAEPDKLKNNQNFKSLWDKKQKATRDNIYKAINEKIPEKKEQGDLLYIYWGGHGISNGYQDRRLFYDDGKQNLNLQSLLQSLKSDTFGTFNQQILIIDACADYHDQVSLFPKEEYPYTSPLIKERQQVILFATKEGYRAKNLDAEKTGLFSKVLLEELQKKDKLLLPKEMREIQDNVVNTFENQYNDEPKPISLYLIDEDGNEIGLNQSAINSNFLEQQYKELSKIIYDIEWNIIKSICYEILLQFSNDPQGSYSELSQTDNFPYLKDIFLNIQHKDSYQVDIKLMLGFAYHLYQYQSTEQAILDKKSDLETWINKTKESFSITEDTFNNLIKIIPKNQNTSNDNDIYKKGDPYLLIICEPVMINRRTLNKQFKLKAELIFQKNDHSKSPTKHPHVFETINSDENDICKNYCSLIDQSYKIMNDNKNYNRLTIELFLPKNYLVNFAPEIEDNNNSEWFGYRYKLVLRSYERFNDNQLYNIFKKNCNTLDELQQQEEVNRKIYYFNQADLNQTQAYNWRDFRRNVEKQGIIGINMNVPLLNEQYTCYIQEFLASVLTCGLPFAFWLREDSLENLKIREEEKIAHPENFLENILNIDSLKNPDILFESIRTIRENAYVVDKQKEYLGYHLGFLFDHPHRVHSQFHCLVGGDVLIGWDS
ncbi:caspase family protein [Trichormus sp. NMC-1]|uniref:caspase family protein n=1 Tax=Trichormus sp. NMC-1 TaxID=1853259 RepID=UPI0008DC0AB6|nr:caspase family protein [Trichormus sp. NMC-1]